MCSKSLLCQTSVDPLVRAKTEVQRGSSGHRSSKSPRGFLAHIPLFLRVPALRRVLLPAVSSRVLNPSSGQGLTTGSAEHEPAKRPVFVMFGVLHSLAASIKCTLCTFKEFIADQRFKGAASDDVFLLHPAAI